MNDFSPLFRWEDVGGRRVAIVGFLIASLLLHALCFYTFQIVYPPAIALLPPPGRVTLITPETAEGRLLLNWLNAEDPALASTTQSPNTERLSLPRVEHQPSYLTHQPALKDVPSMSPNPTLPSLNPPGPVKRFLGTSPVVAQIWPTTVRFSGDLESVTLIEIPEMKFRSAEREAPHAAQFRIGVGNNGNVRYCFLENSSGDAALDEQARRYLMLLRISRSGPSETLPDDDLIWGAATIEWGNDTAGPPPESTGNATP